MQQLVNLIGIDKPLTVDVVTELSPHAPKEIRGQGKDAVSGVTTNYGNRAHIWLNEHLIMRRRCIRVFVMLHELAHAYDPGLSSRKKNKKNTAHYKIVKKCAARKWGVVLHEWYADWQAIQWMKIHCEKEAKELTRFYRGYVKKGKKNPHSPKYPPYDLLVKWLEA